MFCLSLLWCWGCRFFWLWNGLGWWYVGHSFVSCRKEEFFQLSRNFFPVGRKNFFCRKEKLFLKVGQKVLNFRKFEWFTDGQQKKFFLLSRNFFPVGRKNFFCRKEGLGMSEGRTRNVGRKDSECQKDLTRQFTL